jgi:HD-GYP domain-containing protein (c-di-GMP phosphodiesterase class II)
MPTIKKMLLKRSKQLYTAAVFPIVLFIIVVYAILGTLIYDADSDKMEALSELYITKISNVFMEIEAVFNPEMERLFNREYNTSFDVASIKRIKSELKKLEYKTLEIDNINYYRFSEDFEIYDTDFEADRGRSFDKWSFFTETVSKAAPGKIFLKPLAQEGKTGLIRLYAYVRMPDNEIFELGIRFKDIRDLIKSVGKEGFKDISVNIRLLENFDTEEDFYFDESSETGVPVFRIINPWTGEYYISRDSVYGRYDIAITVEVQFIIFMIISGTILLSIVIVFSNMVKKIVSRLSHTLSKPILTLENNMKYFNVDKKDYYVEGIDSEIFELKSIHESFVMMKDEIINSYDELNAMNEELEDSYQENQLLIEKVENLIEIPDFLAYANDMDAFLIKSFEKICSLISNVDYAFVAVVENGIYHYLDFKGFDSEKMNKIKMKVENYIHLETISLRNYEENEFIREGHDIPEVNHELKKIRQMISIPVKSKKKFIGLISLLSKEPGKLKNEDLRMANNFSNYIKGYLTIKELSEFERDVQKETILGIIKLLEKHDSYTKGHSESVANLAADFADFLGLDEKQVQDIYWAGIVHDMGKILIPNSILNKPSRLTDDEFKIIKKHPSYAYDVLKESKSMKCIAEYIKHHHERYDGNGYPDGLLGEKIPYESRILTIADSWDAMTTERVYKKALSAEDALKDLIKLSGIQFDPTLVKKWIEFFNHSKNQLSVKN